MEFHTEATQRILHRETANITISGEKENTHVVESARGDNLNYKTTPYIKIELIAKKTNTHHSFQCEPTFGSKLEAEKHARRERLSVTY